MSKSMKEIMTSKGYTIIDVTIEELPNEGCSNGHYPKVFNKAGECIGLTCRCGNGCSNTTQVYSDENGFNHYIVEKVEAARIF